MAAGNKDAKELIGKSAKHVLVMHVQFWLAALCFIAFLFLIRQDAFWLSAALLGIFIYCLYRIFVGVVRVNRNLSRFNHTHP